MAQINTARLAEIANIVIREVLACSKDIPEMQGREGVYVCVTDTDGTPHALFRVLEPPTREKGRKYCQIAQKKCADLALMRLANVRTTRAFRDGVLERYTGGIVGEDFIFAVSGYTGDLDEICSLAIAVGMQDITREQALQIGVDNPHQAILRHALDHVGNYL